MASSNDGYPYIAQDERVIVAGRSGSGKSTLAKWLLIRSPGHWFIFNPKWTKAFKDLPDAQTIEGFNSKKFEESIFENRFTIYNPLKDENNPDFLDAVIGYLHETYNNLSICCDELYPFHKNGRAGAGLTGLLTRGRELGQGFLGLTQRPAFVSKFTFSEASHIGCMALNLPEDRKTMYETTGDARMRESLLARYWLWYDVGKDETRYFAPVEYKKA